LFETLKRLYKNGSINMQALQNAVAKNWITSEQMQKIVLD